jgi:hypothetical protein
MISKNATLAVDFAGYCIRHPEERFWQALRNWSGHNFILAANSLGPDYNTPTNWLDTFYWEK